MIPIEEKKAELICVIDDCEMSYDEIIKLLRTKNKRKAGEEE